MVIVMVEIIIYATKNSPVSSEAIQLVQVYRMSILNAMGIEDENFLPVTVVYVEDDVDGALEKGILATPTFFIGDKKIIGMPTFEQLKRAVELAGVRA